MLARVDPMDALIDENAALARALGAAQARCTRQVALLSRRIEQLEAELRRQRTRALAEDGAGAFAGADLRRPDS